MKLCTGDAMKPKRPASPWRSPVLVMWALFVLSIPFYVAESGVPQPGNVLIFLLVPMALLQWNGRLANGVRSPFILLLGFTLWVFLVDYGWAAVTQHFGLDDYVVYPAYYIYNALVFLVVLILCQRFGDVFLKLTMDALSLLVAFQVVASFVYGNGTLRGSMFFNNPNQLGYYALLVACLVALCQPRLKFGTLRTSAILLGCAYLAFVSASRAAVGGIAILFVLLTFTNRKVLLASILVVFAMSLYGGPVDKIMDATEKRVEYRKNESLVESRGYDRLWKFKEYIVLGAGEGDFERFSESLAQTKEIHSSAATVLFSYGLVGAGLFLAFVLKTVAGARLRDMLLVVPVLVYTVTHQGLRFTMLWILLAVFLAIKPRKVPLDRRSRIASWRPTRSHELRAIDNHLAADPIPEVGTANQA